MSIVPRLVETIFRDPFGDVLPFVGSSQPTYSYSVFPRDVWRQTNQALRQLERLGDQMVQEFGAVKDSKDSFEVNLDVKHFKPEEINVKLVDKNNLVIEAKHEERSDEHGYISRQFSRRYVLPDNVELEKLESQLGVDGVLAIKAPKKPLGSIEGERKIPITLTNQVYRPVEGGKKEQQQQSNQEKMETK